MCERRLLGAVPEQLPEPAVVVPPPRGCVSGSAKPALRGRGSSEPRSGAEHFGHGRSWAESSPAVRALATAGELWPLPVPWNRRILRIDQSRDASRSKSGLERGLEAAEPAIATGIGLVSVVAVRF